MTSRERLLITPTILLAITLAASMVAAPVLAASPHFIGTPTIIKNPNGSLTVKFKATGLGTVASNAFLTSSGGTAVLQCVNPGGDNPPPNSFGPLQGQTTTIEPRNGQITAVVTIGPAPLPTASQICSDPNATVQKVSLTYDNVELHIQKNGVDILTFNFGNVDP